MNLDGIFKTVGLIVCWALAAVLGLAIFSTLAGAIVAFASTGIGAIILAIIGFKIWKDYIKE